MASDLSEITPSAIRNNELLIQKINFDLRVAIPAIVKSFDAEKQTITAQVALRERVIINNVINMVDIPILEDVPIYMPRAGNFILTMPIEEGDECLIIFADTCIDSWWDKGEELNNPLCGRRHNLSDGIALIGIWSQPNVIGRAGSEPYSEDTVQLRTLDGKNYIELADDEVNIKTTGVINIESAGNTNIKSTGGDIAIESEGGDIDITASGALAIESTGDAVSVIASGNVDVEGAEVNITGGTVNVTGDEVILAEGVYALIDERFQLIYDNHFHSIAEIGDTGVPNNAPTVLIEIATVKTKGG